MRAEPSKLSSSEHDVAARDALERAKFHLKLFCEDCALFDELAGCAHGYPTAPHRRARVEAGACVIFCKHFESA